MLLHFLLSFITQYLFVIHQRYFTTFVKYFLRASMTSSGLIRLAVRELLNQVFQAKVCNFMNMLENLTFLSLRSFYPPQVATVSLGFVGKYRHPAEKFFLVQSKVLSTYFCISACYYCGNCLLCFKAYLQFCEALSIWVIGISTLGVFSFIINDILSTVIDFFL